MDINIIDSIIAAGGGAGMTVGSLWLLLKNFIRENEQAHKILADECKERTDAVHTRINSRERENESMQERLIKMSEVISKLDHKLDLHVVENKHLDQTLRLYDESSRRQDKILETQQFIIEEIRNKPKTTKI